MDNPPRPGPARPWLRLASIARPTILPAPAPATVEPRQPLSQPTLRPTDPAAVFSPPPPLPPPPVLAPVPLSEPPPPPPAFIPGPVLDPLPFSPVARVSASSSSLPPSPSSLLNIPAIKAASPPPAALPSAATFSVPPSPKPRVSAPTTPLLRASTIGIPALVRGPAITPTPSPTLIKTPSKTPYQSPKPKPTAPPPSQLALPPSQLKPDQPEPESKLPPEPDQKTVLLPKRSPEKPAHHASSGKHHQKADHEASKKDEEREKTKQKKAAEHEKQGMGVITLAGENRGAFMEITMTSNGGKSKLSETIRGGGHFSADGHGREGKLRQDYNQTPFTIFTNSNVQGVTNSILFKSSCSHHDPGVHLAFSAEPSAAHGNHRKNRHES